MGGVPTAVLPPTLQVLVLVLCTQSPKQASPALPWVAGIEMEPAVTTHVPVELSMPVVESNVFWQLPELPAGLAHSSLSVQVAPAGAVPTKMLLHAVSICFPWSS